MITLIGIAVISLAGFSQSPSGQERIKAARIALITERLGLTPQQAEKFWPLYNEFTQEREALNRQLREARQGKELRSMSEAESKKFMEFAIEVRERHLGLERDYSNRLLDIITAQQVLALRKAEQDFAEMIRMQIQRRREQQRRMQDMRNRRDGVMRDRKNN